MTKDTETCSAYDQISDRRCRYYADHGGKHNFARLDHDVSLERELRRRLDAMTRARDEACDQWEAWEENGHGASGRQRVARIAELRKVGVP